MHKCKVAKNGKRHCHVHGLPLSSVRYVFADIILNEYSKAELRNIHKQAAMVMLDYTNIIQMDDS